MCVCVCVCVCVISQTTPLRRKLSISQACCLNSTNRVSLCHKHTHTRTHSLTHIHTHTHTRTHTLTSYSDWLLSFPKLDQFNKHYISALGNLACPFVDTVAGLFSPVAADRDVGSFISLKRARQNSNLVLVFRTLEYTNKHRKDYQNCFCLTGLIFRRRSKVAEVCKCCSRALTGVMFYNAAWGWCFIYENLRCRGSVNLCLITVACISLHTVDWKYVVLTEIVSIIPCHDYIGAMI